MAEPITAFPLCWPAGWKRAKSRARADFGKEKQSSYTVGDKTYVSRRRERLTVNEGVGRLLATLKRMGVPDYNVIVSTNVRTRLDGLPYSNQSEPSDPGVAVYWKRYGQQKCMAVDRYDKVADNLAAIAATLEAMRAIDRHGGAEILERAFLGFQQLPPPFAGQRPWKDVLELNGDATIEKAEERYRDLAKKYHPDHGGDPVKFAEVADAIRQAREALK
jgi:hypothetical protein